LSVSLGGGNAVRENDSGRLRPITDIPGQIVVIVGFPDARAGAIVRGALPEIRRAAHRVEAVEGDGRAAGRRSMAQSALGVGEGVRRAIERKAALVIVETRRRGRVRICLGGEPAQSVIGEGGGDGSRVGPTTDGATWQSRRKCGP